MCALVLALRKVPIYAPGGGNASLGSADQPSYSVAVSDDQAAAARDAFAKTKADKRMKTMKPSKSWNDLGATTSAQPNNNAGSLRNRAPEIGPLSETEALNTLNTRSPTADIAQDWQSDDTSTINRRPSSKHNPHLGPGGDQRNKDIDEVYGLLHRASTRGKRRESYGLPRHSESLRNSTSNNTVPIIEEPRLPASSYNYHDYAREVSGAGQSKASPPRGDTGRLAEGGNGAAGFGASYNPYVTPAPRYEYPPQPASPPRSAAAPLTSSSVYPSPLKTTGTSPAQERAMDPTAMRPLGTPNPSSRPGTSGTGRKNAYAAELDGEGRP